MGLFHTAVRGAGDAAHDESKALQKRVRAVTCMAPLHHPPITRKKVLAEEMLHDKRPRAAGCRRSRCLGFGCWRAETIPVRGLRPLLGVWRNKP